MRKQIPAEPIHAATALVLALLLAGCSTSDDRSDRRDRRRFDEPESIRGATHSCTMAAEREASIRGEGRVIRINEVKRKDDGYDVDGEFVVRLGPGPEAELERGEFSCSIRSGRIDRLRLR